MLTNALRRRVRDLSRARDRKESGWFRVEGEKCVLEALGAFTPVHVFATAEWIAGHKLGGPVTQCTMKDLELMSGLVTPPPVIGVFRLPERGDEHFIPPADRLVLALDAVQDPGNLGTIIRLCDWMGVDTILAGEGTADAFAPKVVQAAMGAIARVKIIYCDLPTALKDCEGPVFGTFLDGEDLYNARFTPRGVIVMGNEGNGISPGVASLVTRRLTIPSYPPGRPTSESLNVAVAAAITLSQFRQRQSM